LRQELLAYPTWPNDEPIPFRERGDGVHMIRGSSPSLRYRGRAIGRHKIWAQSSYGEGLRLYRYPGWMWKISYATHAVQHVAPVQRVATALNQGLVKSGHRPHNHWIVTRYDDGRDSISAHRDRPDDLAPNSSFVVIKLGAPRPFEFSLNSGKVIFSKPLPAGTAVFVRCNAPGGGDANSIVKHAVPKTKAAVGLSGSIVSRRIVTLVPWSEVHAEVQRRTNPD
jgi:alkylated DNA repair dioxygenase AlkB